MNKVILIGNLTRDPETLTKDNWVMCKFGLAVRRDNDNADFLNIIAFGQLAENCAKYLAKGRKVAVDGRVQANSYKDKDGKNVKFYDIVAEKVEFLGAVEPQPEKTVATLSKKQEIEDDKYCPF
jgi:single-strand DNA-binding protein